MRVKSMLDGRELEVHLSTEHAASSYGQPVAVTEDGEALDAFSWTLYRAVDATNDEVWAFEAAGYPVVY